jgi:hypothetical protein
MKKINEAWDPEAESPSSREIEGIADRISSPRHKRVRPSSCLRLGIDLVIPHDKSH